MKKIAIFCHDYSLSGANLSLLDYLKVYDRNSFSITVFIPKNNTYGLASELNKINVAHHCFKLFVVTKNINSISLKEKFKKAIKILYNLIFGKYHFHKLVKFVKKEKFDDIISNSFAVLYGAKISNLLGIHHIFHIREFMENDHQITHANKNKVKLYCENSSAIFISNSIKEYYLKKYRFMDYKVIYNRIDFDKTFTKSREFYKNHILNILIAGTLQPNKGQLDAIKAVELIKDEIEVRLFICGQGPDENNLKKYCTEKGLKNIIFTGQIEKDELIELRKGIDISLVCSKMEALGRVTVESMYYESLTIGSNTGETAYLLSDKRGYLYKNGDIKNLADNIKKSVILTDEVKEIINNAKMFAIRKFSNDVLWQIFKDDNCEVLFDENN